MIVLIGNAQESEHRLNDCSAIIDSGKPRLVVRVSKMCNYDSGKTGTRCDWVFPQSQSRLLDIPAGAPPLGRPRRRQ